MMNREFIHTSAFDRKWRLLGLNDEDLTYAQEFLLAYPEAGDMIQGTGGLRKIRIPLYGKGKSGGARLIYIDFASYSKIYLIGVFSKSEKQNLSDFEKNAISKIIAAIKQNLR